MSDATLTLQEAADDLGVHYMTAYRYVRLGLLPAQKLGGVWQVDRADLEQFRSGNGNAPVRAGRPAPWAERLEARLLAGDARGAWGVVEAALAAGSELDEIYLDVLTPAMTSIGNRWSAGEIDIGLEHRATGIAMRLVGRLGPRFVRRGRSRGAVVLATPAGEMHALSVAVLADLLRLEGWEVSDLGADTPAESLGLAAAHPEVVAVGISVTHPQHHDACRESCAAVRRHAPGVVIIAGGQGVDRRETAIALGAHEHAASAKEMVRVLDRLPGILDVGPVGDAAAGA